MFKIVVEKFALPRAVKIISRGGAIAFGLCSSSGGWVGTCVTLFRWGGFRIKQPETAQSLCALEPVKEGVGWVGTPLPPKAWTPRYIEPRRVHIGTSSSI